MRISTKGRYGLRVMLELALRHGNGPTRMAEIARIQGISRKYMHNLLTRLKDAGLVRAIRGAGGGFDLARTPARIRVSEIVAALEGPFHPVDCVADPNRCDRARCCVAREVWRDLGTAMERTLSAVTLDGLVAREQRGKGRTAKPDA